MSAVIDAAVWLRDATAPLAPGGIVAYTYHPLSYAWAPHKAYLERYGQGRKKALLVGMNPGPWGMAQNGIPFGERAFVADWLGLAGAPIGRPAVEHPKRPVLGWDCTRSEASGKRLWGFLKETYGTPEAALGDLLIVNHCPLVMYTESGTNVTPDKLRRAERDMICGTCDEGLLRMVDATGAELLIGVGKYAEERCRGIAARRDVAVTSILHPSPASPLANRESGDHWRRETRRTFAAAGLI